MGTATFCVQRINVYLLYTIGCKFLLIQWTMYTFYSGLVFLYVYYVHLGM